MYWWLLTKALVELAYSACSFPGSWLAWQYQSSHLGYTSGTIGTSLFASALKAETASHLYLPYLVTSLV